MQGVRGVVGPLLTRLTRPSYPIPLVFVLMVGTAAGIITGIALLFVPAGHAWLSLLAALLLPDVFLVAAASMIAGRLIHRTTQPARQFTEVVQVLARERFAATAAPQVAPEYETPLNEIWALGRGLTARERELTSVARELEHRYIEARNFIDLMAEINRALGLRNSLEALANGLSRFFAGDAVAIWVWQPSGGLALAVEAGGSFPPMLGGQEDWVRAALAGHGQAGVLLLKDALASLAAPLQDGAGTSLGVVLINSFKRTGYTPAEAAFFAAMINHARLAIQNGIAYDQRDTLSRLDSLTGLQNRREFDRLIAIETERSRRYHQPLSLLMIDIDHFKQVNDRRGHPAGDWALQEVGRLLMQMKIRVSDFAFRLGGEEFAILLTQTDKPGAIAVAERLRQLVSLHQMFADGSGVTVSIGVASFPTDVAEPSQLLARADQALYAAKQTGRNRVVAA